jgi:hypothetical protein
MSIIRVRKDEKYFTASNEPFVDKRLSWEARGLMGYLLTKPDNWQVRIEDLQKQGPAKLHKIRRMLAEARLYGYMNRTRLVRADGTFDWLTEVFESPSQNPSPSSSVRFSTSGSPTTGKPADIVITDLKITELLSDEKERTRKANQIPEVVLYRSVTGIYPPKVNFDDVIKAVLKVRDRLGRDVKREDLLTFYKSWCGKGYKPNNLAWLEWAETGLIPVNGNWKPRNEEPKGFDAARNFLERHSNVNS